METWNEFFAKERDLPYYQKMHEKVMQEYKDRVIYPPYHDILNAFKLTPLKSTNAIIIGQDPYHEKGQAMGLAFSVPKDKELPPSLKNIYQEIGNEYHQEVNQDGDLTYLAKQGVLLLNRTLTVREHQANSHQDYGYDILLMHVMEVLNKEESPKVFLLWGSFAISLRKYITNPKHLILTSPHPSPLSAYRGFFGNNHFIKANEFLRKNNLPEIKWIKKDYFAGQ